MKLEDKPIYKRRDKVLRRIWNMVYDQQWSKMSFMFNDKWLVDMYVNLLLAYLKMMLIAEATCGRPTENEF